MAKIRGTHKVVRDAKTGQFLTKGTEKRRPSTTVTEQIRNPKRRKRA
jgi:hypothetical protein